MTRKEQLAVIKTLKSNPRISEFWINPRYGKHHREDSVWYEGEVMSFLIDGRFRYYCCAYGEVRITHVPTEDDVVNKSNNAQDVIDFLEAHGYTTDKKVFDGESRGELYFSNNSWFEDEVWDSKKKKWFNFSFDVSDGPLTIDLYWLDEVINQYKKDEGEI